eukprot:365836-Chlamydomonas_euryale.AAC.3
MRDMVLGMRNLGIGHGRNQQSGQRNANGLEILPALTARLVPAPHPPTTTLPHLKSEKQYATKTRVVQQHCSSLEVGRGWMHGWAGGRLGVGGWWIYGWRGSVDEVLLMGSGRAGHVPGVAMKWWAAGALRVVMQWRAGGALRVAME